jgi:hypothetical protein
MGLSYWLRLHLMKEMEEMEKIEEMKEKGKEGDKEMK